MPTREERLRAMQGHASGTSRRRTEMSGLDTASAAASQFSEGLIGIGDEASAFGAVSGSLLYDLIHGVTTANGRELGFGEIVSKNLGRFDTEIDTARERMDTLDETNPLLSNAMYGAGIVTGLFGPAAATLASKGSVAARGALTAAEGAGYGYLAGRDEDRLTGAAVGGVLGGALGTGVAKLGDSWAARGARLDAERQEKAALALAEHGDGTWTMHKTRMGAWEEWATGVSDALRRIVSPEFGGRIQRADETAMRTRTLQTTEYLENLPMQNVIRLADEDDMFKARLLDFGKGYDSPTNVIKYVRDNLGEEEATAFTKYLRWSAEQNSLYNRMLGDSALDPVKYLHTQVKQGSGVTGKTARPDKANRVGFEDDTYNILPKDAAEMVRTRQNAVKLGDNGELELTGLVRLDEYENPLLTNANRIFNNQRLLEIQNVFKIKPINKGAEGLMGQLEGLLRRKGATEITARDGRNAVAALIKGQNRAANDWIQTYQNTIYGATLAGPKSAILNLHDIPVALWNNGVASVKGLVNRELRTAADIDRLGINQQNVGEFVQEARKFGSTDKTRLQKVSTGTQKATEGLMKWSGFRWMDQIGKNSVLRTVAQDTVARARNGSLRERWGTYFDAKDLNLLEYYLKESGGNIAKFKDVPSRGANQALEAKQALKLYDEVMTLGLGQQQLISAAGRPLEWLNRPNARVLWSMRGFAIKHNALLAEKILKPWKAGNTAEAVRQAAGYIALPGAGYAGLNLGRQAMFGGENYEPSGEEFVYSMMDALLGPVTLNSVGVGTSYERNELMQNPVQRLMVSVLPPGGYSETVGKAAAKAVSKGDPEELAGLITELPLYKQWSNFIEEQ
jgi:hypothetical protein